MQPAGNLIGPLVSQPYIYVYLPIVCVGQPTNDPSRLLAMYIYWGDRLAYPIYIIKIKNVRKVKAPQ